MAHNYWLFWMKRLNEWNEHKTKKKKSNKKYDDRMMQSIKEELKLKNICNYRVNVPLIHLLDVYCIVLHVRALFWFCILLNFHFTVQAGKRQSLVGISYWLCCSIFRSWISFFFQFAPSCRCYLNQINFWFVLNIQI